MDLVWWVLVAIGLVLLGFALVWKFVLMPFLVDRIFLAHAQPLSDEELQLCSAIVQARRGYPYVCKAALKYKKCGCLPCAKLEQAKRDRERRD